MKYMKSCKKVLLLTLFLAALFVSFFVTIQEGMSTYKAPALEDLTGFVFFIKPNDVSPQLVVEVDKLKAKGPFVRVSDCTQDAVKNDYNLKKCPSTAKLYKKGKYVKDYMGPMNVQDWMQEINHMLKK
jgi:hypothetical protein